MNKSIVAMVALACAFSSSPASSDQLTTQFSISYSVNGVGRDAQIPTPANKSWLLPSDLSDWECEVTGAFMAKDGLSIYHNVVCVSISTNAVIGTSIYCPLNKEGYGQSGFFLRKGNTDLSVAGSCRTYSTGAKAKPTTT